MKQLLILTFAISFLFVSCDNNNTDPEKNASDSPTNSGRKVTGSQVTDTSQMDENGNVIRLTVIPDGIDWVKAYQKMVKDDKKVSLQQIPNMIWLSASYV